MHILYVSALESNAGFGGEWFFDRALRRLGHTTFGVDYRRHRWSLYGELQAVPPCDVALIQRGEGLPLPLLESIAVPRFFWDTETPGKVAGHLAVLRSGLFKHQFFWTQGILDQYANAGWIRRENASVLSGGFDPEIHRPLAGVAKDIDVLFLGTVTERRRALIESVRDRLPVTVMSAFGEAMVEGFSRARIVLNIHADQYPIVPSRVYEALGCGAFLLTERLSADNPFTADKHLVEFATADELVSLATRYLQDDAQRERIGRAGHEAALAGHTFDHRAAQFVAVAERYLAAEACDRRHPFRPTWRAHAYRATQPLRRLVDWSQVRTNQLRRSVQAARK